VDVDARLPEVREGAAAAVVGADDREESHGHAEPRECDRLIRRLAAVQGLLEAVCENALARRRNRVDMEQETLRVRTDNDDGAGLNHDRPRASRATVPAPPARPTPLRRRGPSRGRARLERASASPARAGGCARAAG